MQVGGIAAWQVDYGLQRVNAVMKQAIDATIDDAKKHLRFAVGATEDSDHKEKGQHVNVVA